MSELIGKTIGQYQIIEQIGKGGMATVFKAYQASIDRYVALKILPSQFAEDPDFVRRFEHEAKAIAALEHPHILPVHDFGTEGNRPYMVMRYVEGGTLAKMMGKPLSDERIVQIVGNIARALNYAHQQGVVHRDIKPSNILIDQHGEVLLTDFGIAKMIEGSGGTQLTKAGSILGTPAYMAPEQAEGTQVDGRSDIYALGVVLYELLTGQPPYRAETPLAVVLKHLNDPLPPPRTIKSDVAEPLERVVLKAMAKEPGQRFQSADEMEQALRNAQKEIENSSGTADQSATATQIDELAQDTTAEIATPTPATSGRSIAMPLLIGGGIVALLICLAGGAIVTVALLSSSDEIAEVPTAAGNPDSTVAPAVATPDDESPEPTTPPDAGPVENEPISFDIEGLDGDLMFEDRFDANENAWSTGEFEDEFGRYEADIVGGRYQMKLTATTDDGFFVLEEMPEAVFDDFVLSVEATPVERNADFSYGVGIRGNEADEEYEFMIGSDNTYSVAIFVDEEWQPFVEAEPLSAIRSDGPNQLVVKANGPVLTFFINGEEAASIEDDTFQSGTIGFLVDVYEADAPVTVEYDNLVIREISEDEQLNDEAVVPDELEASADGILFEDTFDTDENGWATGEFEDEYTLDEITIEDGQYRMSIEAKQSAYVEKVLPNQSFADFVLTVEATPRDDAEHYSYGVAFREDRNGNSYAFEIGNDGLYAIFLFDGEWHILKDWSSSATIEPGATNTITIIAEDDSFTFEVNDVELTTLEDDTLAEGTIGLIVELFEDETSAIVDFDNLVIRSIEDGE